MADPVIQSKIPLTDAMGVTKGMTPQMVSNKWIKWSSKYPEEKSTLSPAVVVSLDALSSIVTIYETITTVISTLQTAVLAAGKAFSTAQLVVPGLGSAAGAKQLVEEATAIAKLAIDEAIKKMQKIPQEVYDSLTNTKVNESAKI